jgi:hypothetical protein
MADLSDLELFQRMGCGGHRHDDLCVIAGVMGVCVMQMLHQFREHGGHRVPPFASSLPGRLWSMSMRPDMGNDSAHTQIRSSEDLMKKAGDRFPDLGDEDAANLPIQTTIDCGKFVATKIPAPSCYATGTYELH